MSDPHMTHSPARLDTPRGPRGTLPAGHVRLHLLLLSPVRTGHSHVSVLLYGAGDLPVRGLSAFH
jgi:hypothetical protein